MSEFSIISEDFKEGEEIPKKFGYKFENKIPNICYLNSPRNTETLALIMDDPDAMAAVGKVWVHWLEYGPIEQDLPHSKRSQGITDFGEIGYGGPAPPNGRHTYVFKGYALDVKLDLKEGYTKQDLENAMKGNIIAEAKLTGTFAP
jgi:Raf kinase inhibitor-like YbhB/YbcL family protein|tara:strand:- start:59 stop:496 length:438 start_codon:yes stop_codon:yes gene_type:complete